MYISMRFEFTYIVAMFTRLKIILPRAELKGIYHVTNIICLYHENMYKHA